MSEQYELYGGTPPHAKGSDTSAEAAEKIRRHVGPLQKRVVAFVRGRGGFGATCDEIEEAFSRMDPRQGKLGKHQTISARVKECRDLNLIRKSGFKRKTRSNRNAWVYVVTT